MLKVEVLIHRSFAGKTDRTTGLATNLEGILEEEQVDQIEQLFASVLFGLYEYKYKLEITERE